MKPQRVNLSPVHSTLIVDDQVQEASSLEKVLYAIFDVVDVARSAEEAFEALKLKPYDLLFLDCLAAHGENMELLRKIRNQGVRSPIVLMSAHVTPDITLSAYKMGVIDLLPKPSPPEMICQVAAEVLKRHGVEQRQTFTLDLSEIKYKINHCQFEEARKDLEKYVERKNNEGLVEAHIFLAMTYEILGVFESAEKVYKHVLKTIYHTEASSSSKIRIPKKRQWLDDEISLLG